MAAAEPRALDATLQKRVDRMLEKGKEPDEIEAMLVAKGWPPDVARATAEREDRRYQSQLREENMANTHGPQAAARATAAVSATLFSVYIIYRGVMAFLRFLAE